MDATPMDAERLAHLRQLQRVLRRNLDALELRKASHGVDVPVEIVNGIAETKADLQAVEAALKSPLSAQVLDEIGAAGQVQVLLEEIRVLRQGRAAHDRFDAVARAERQRIVDRQWLVIVALLVVIAMGLVVLIIQNAL